MGFYLDDEAIAYMKTYKYSGADLSYVYRFILTPMNIFLVEYFPLWLAPNMITLISFVLTLMANLLTAYYSPSFDSPVPSWLCFLVAILLFAYQTLDNLDGRQARRTLSSSPLGLLFDHGVDCMNVTITTMTLASVFQVGITWRIWAFWLMAFCPFVCATWEEYFTGSLILGRFNGPTDGFLLAITFCIITGLSPGYWAREIGVNFPSFPIHAMKSNPTVDIMILIGYVGLIPTLGANLHAVYTRSLVKFQTAFDPLFKLTPFLILAQMGLLWTLYSPSKIWNAHPRVFMWGLGFLFGNMICKLMLAHLTGKDYKIYRLVLIPLILATSNCLIGQVIPGQPPLIPEIFCLYVTAIFHFSTWLHFVYNVINEITAALGIKCFTIIPKTKSQ